MAALRGLVVLSCAVVLFLPKWANAACTPTQTNCFATPRNMAPSAGATATRTCGLASQFGEETFSFGGLVFGSTFPTATTALCNGTSDAIVSHPAERFNDVSTATWWQSPYGVQDAVIRLDLPNRVLLSQTTVTFRSIPPAAMQLEYSVDGGMTWTAYQYFASDCSGTFNLPQASTATAPSNTDAICTGEGIFITTALEDRQKVSFNPTLRLGASRFTNLTVIDRYLYISNLRIVFSALNLRGLSFAQRASFSRSFATANRYYYGVYEWDLSATCHCFGHADTCMVQAGDQPTYPTGCNCSHNTMGTHCDQCQPLYRNRAWQPGTDLAANECQRCNCSGHATECTFNAIFGFGVCTCQHNTRGFNCERCSAQFYRDAALPNTNSGSCVACSCDTAHTVGGSNTCDETTGQCECLPGVSGRRCTECVSGTHSLTAGTGCVSCQCDADGTLPGRTCHASNGTCPCKANVEGANCDKCKAGFYGPSALAPLDGCYQCLCSSKTTSCTHATGYRLSSLTSNFSLDNSEDHGWTFRSSQSNVNALPLLKTIVTIGSTEFVPAIAQTIQHGDVQGIFLAPQSMVQSLRYAVGHRFSFGMQTSPLTMTGTQLVTPRPPGDVIIYTNLTRIPSIAAVLEIDPVQGVPAQHTILLYPGRWRIGTISGRVATLAEVVAALNYATDLAIRGVYFNNAVPLPTQTAIYGVSLEAAVISGDQSLPEARNVEQCICPAGYSGSDCGQCTSPTYSRNYQLRLGSVPALVDQFDNCSLCSCNGHTTSCDMLTGVCSGCGDNTRGDHCELCTDTFFGDATSAAIGCPACQCNATGSRSAICDRGVSGQCPCQNNVVGRQCNQCRATTYNFNSGTGCIACECNVDGVTSSQCSAGDCNCGQVGDTLGQCPCKSLVTGNKCTACQFGTQGKAPNCTVCHPCFDAWLAIIQQLRDELARENNRTLDTMQAAFGSMTPTDISLMLGTVQGQLGQVRTQLASRQEDQLDGVLSQVDSTVQQLTTTLTFLMVAITNAESGLNRSIDTLALIRIFNGSISATADGSHVTAQIIEIRSKQEEVLVQQVQSNFSDEEAVLASTVAQILATEADVNASRQLAATGQSVANDALATGSRAAAGHVTFEAANRDNSNLVQQLDQALSVLEEDISNATSLLASADIVALAANTTAHQARLLASQQIGLAQQLASNASSLAESVNQTSTNASDVSASVQSLLTAATAAAGTAQSTLIQAETVNRDFSAALDQLRAAEQSASAALAAQLPSLELINNLSSQINESIVPEAEVNQTLTNARESLRQADAILKVAQSAFNMSTLAYQTVSGIRDALLQHNTQKMTADQALVRAQLSAERTNASLQQVQTLASQLSSQLADGATQLQGVEQVLSRVGACQQAASSSVASSHASAQQDCTNLQGRINQTVSEGEDTALRVQSNATAQQRDAQSAQQLAQNTASAASQVQKDAADPTSMASLQALLARYTTLSANVEAAQARTENQQAQLESVITDLLSVSGSSCSASSAP